MPDLTVSTPYAVEREAMERAVPSRRAEFVTGRSVARAALAELGVPAGPIARRPDRAPDWPPGIVGSITHTRGLCAAVVARHRGVLAPPLGLGIDVEVDAVIDDAVVQRVLTTRERAALGASTGRDAVVAFSAKESLFKAINPLTGVWLEANDVEVELTRDDHLGTDEIDGGTIGVLSWARTVPGFEPADAIGCWTRVGPWVATAIVLSPRSARVGR